MQLKKDTPRYTALKKHEDELIEALRKVDMASLARNAVKYDLVPKDMEVHIESLQPSIPHPLVCRYLFFHVYATIQKPSSTTAKSYKWWLMLLSDLELAHISDVVVRIEKSKSDIESILASRDSPEGDLLHINDIPVLAKVLSGHQFSTCWKQLVYSLPLSKGDIIKLPLEDPNKALKQLLMKWASKFPNASIRLLQQSLNMCSDANMHLDISKVVSSSRNHERTHILKKHGRIDESNCGVLSDILKDYSAALIKYANCLLLPPAETKLLTDAIRTMTPEECLKKVLTMWVENEFHHARLPTLTNLEVLPVHKTFELRNCLRVQATHCQSFENIFKTRWTCANCTTATSIAWRTF